MFSSIEITMLRKVDTGLPVNLWIDEKINKTSRLMFQNNKSDTFTGKKDLIAITVDENPEIPLRKYNLKITSEEFNIVRKFISLNKTIILKYMNDTTFGLRDFFTNMQSTSKMS